LKIMSRTICKSGRSSVGFNYPTKKSFHLIFSSQWVTLPHRSDYQSYSTHTLSGRWPQLNLETIDYEAITLHTEPNRSHMSVEKKKSIKIRSWVTLKKCLATKSFISGGGSKGNSNNYVGEQTMQLCSEKD